MHLTENSRSDRKPLPCIPFPKPLKWSSSFTSERKTGALNQGDCRCVIYSTMKRSDIFDKISQTYFGTLPPAELSLAVGLKKCWSYVAFLQAVENFTLSLYASISDLYFGIMLMHYYWVKSFSLVLLKWVMILTELFAKVHLAIYSSISDTFKTQWSFLCYVAVHYIILKAPSEKAQVLHQQRQDQK